MVNLITSIGFANAVEECDGAIKRRRRVRWLPGLRREKRRKIIATALSRIENLENSGLQINKSNIYAGVEYKSVSAIAWILIKIIVPLIIDWYLKRKLK